MSVMKKVQISLLALVVLASALIFFIPTDAKASCWTPKRKTYTYYGWEYDYAYHCTAPIVGPPLPAKPVGEKVVECDGTISSQWGITCSNFTVQTENCETICN